MKAFKIVVKVLLITLLALTLAAPVLAKGNAAQIELPALTVENISLLIAAVASLALDYAPGLAKKWDALSKEAKKRYYLLSVIVIVAAAYLLHCNGVISTGGISCTEQGILDLVVNVIYVFAIGTGFHIGTKPGKEQKAKMFK